MDSSAANTRKTLLYIAIAIVCITIAVVLFNWRVGGVFLTVTNINALCISAALTSFTAWGYCFVFALNYMDLSIGAAVVLCMFSAGEFGNRFGYPGVILGGVIVGVIMMSINFNVFAWTKIPSWIAGLGMCLIYEAIASYYTAVKQSHSEITVLIKDEYRGLGFAPGIYAVFLFALFFSYFIYNRTSVGLNVRAIGSNPSVAKAMGINIPVTLVLTGIVCGVLIGCTGFVRESYMGRIFALTGLTSLASIFQPLATVLLAQVLSRRINIIIAVPFCALFIFICFNALTIIGVPSGTLQESVLGLSVIIFGIIAQRGTKGLVK